MTTSSDNGSGVVRPLSSTVRTGGSGIPLRQPSKSFINKPTHTIANGTNGTKPSSQAKTPTAKPTTGSVKEPRTTPDNKAPPQHVDPANGTALDRRNSNPTMPTQRHKSTSWEREDGSGNSPRTEPVGGLSSPQPAVPLSNNSLASEERDSDSEEEEQQVKTQAARRQIEEEINLACTPVSAPKPQTSPPAPEHMNGSLSRLRSILLGFEQQSPPSPKSKSSFSSDTVTPPEVQVVPPVPVAQKTETPPAVLPTQLPSSPSGRTAIPILALNTQAEKALKRVSWNASETVDCPLKIPGNRASMREIDDHFTSDASSDREQDETDKLAMGGMAKPSPFESTVLQSARNAFKIQENKTRAFLGCKVTMRLKVTDVNPAGAAHHAGVLVGDVVLGTDSITFKNGQDFVQFVSDLSAGDNTCLRVDRTVKGKTTTLTLPMCVGAVPLELSDADKEARQVYLDILKQHKSVLDETSSTQLRTMLQDRPRFDRWVKVSFTIVDNPPTGRINRLQYRNVIQLFANAMSMNKPLEETIDVVFVQKDSHRTGYLNFQETADAAFEYFSCLVENYKPLNNPLTVLKKENDASKVSSSSSKKQ